MKFNIKGPFNKKNMSQDKHTMEEHHENEEVKAAGEPFSLEISPEITPSSALPGQSEIEKLQSELAETRDKFLRIYSEFDNYKKRTQRERLELLKSASAEVMVALLPVLDDFDRALKSAESGSSESNLLSGVELIFSKLKLLMEQKGLRRMNSVGEKFDTEFHEAITNVPAPDENQKGKVIDEAESGYFLNDKVIRHAKAIVGI
ncbi:MAG: nucleotide exchange factor GrpE [Bacteroidota bacterium]|nr:nucleotide exchange factor GrpE [Bacteroidota bacterium]